MRASLTSLPVYLAALFGIAGLLSLADAGPVERPASYTTPAAAKAVPDLSGSWTGNWTDTVYLVGGDITMDITIDGADWTGTGSIDLSSIGLFGVGVVTGSATGTVIDNSLNFDFSADGLGQGSGVLIDGEGYGGGTTVAPVDFGFFSFNGTLTASEISGTFDFDAPTGGAGDVTLTRAVPAAESSWSDLKAAWR